MSQTIPPDDIPAETRLGFVEITDPSATETEATLTVTYGDQDDLLTPGIRVRYGIERFRPAQSDWVNQVFAVYRGGPNRRPPAQKFDPPQVAFTMTTQANGANNKTKGARLRGFIRSNVALNFGGTFDVVARA